jgi:hypothetical protein
MAGELGFEPRSSVLETDSLTVELTPPWSSFQRLPEARGWRRLLGFLVRRVLTARVAELLELQTTGRGLLVLGRRVVAVLAIGALKGDDFAHVVTPIVAGHFDRQAACLSGKFLHHPPSTPRRRA